MKLKNGAFAVVVAAASASAFTFFYLWGSQQPPDLVQTTKTPSPKTTKGIQSSAVRTGKTFDLAAIASSYASNSPKNVTMPGAGSVAVCRGLSASSLDRDLLPQSPFKDPESWEKFLSENGGPFDDLRATLLSPGIVLLTDAGECYRASGAEEVLSGNVTFTLRTNAAGTDAEISGIDFVPLAGSAGSISAAMTCLKNTVFSKLPYRVRNDKARRWPQYEGVYPRRLKVYFGSGANLFSGQTE